MHHIDLSDYSMADLVATIRFAKERTLHFRELLDTDKTSGNYEIYKNGWEFWTDVLYRVEEEVYKRIENRFEYLEYQRKSK